MKERKNRAKKIRGVKKVKADFLNLFGAFLMATHFLRFCFFNLCCRQRLRMLPRLERRNEIFVILIDLICSNGLYLIALFSC